MTHKQIIGNRIMSVFLAIAILFAMIPLTKPMAVSAASVNSNRIADPSTMDSWKDFFPITGDISTENAGGVWMDKSVFIDASAFDGLGISQDDPNSFLVALSAMAANMSVTGMSHVPTDSILVLDVSGSMNDGDNDVAEELVESANASIKALLETNSYNRVGVVLYSGSSSSSSNYTTGAVVLLPLDRYTTGSDGRYLNYEYEWGFLGSTETISLDADLRIEGTNTRPTAVSKEVVGATYMQRGIITAMNQFLADDNEVVVDAQYRKPVLVLMSDGAPSLGSTYFTDPGYNQSSGYNLGTGSGTSAALGFVSQLSAAYAKAKIEEKYGTDALFYTLGLGLSNNDTVAIGVLDPDNARASTALADFWDSYNAPGATSVTVQSARVVEVIDTPLEQNYVDRYFEASGSSGSLADELAQAFEDIVGAIQLQSSYYPTLISGDEDLSGYISFVDKIGQYMEVTDIKGILINNQLFSGADLASNFVSNGGNLGTYDKPTALGMEMVAAVRARLGLESDEVAATLIGLAYENGQLSYTDKNNFSNYIGWYANAAGEFLGFYNEGTTVLPPTTGDPVTDPAFVIRSYGYLGAVDASHGVSESDMMYATVQVRKEIATGEELVTFAVPAALIPTVTYNVTLDEDGSLADLTATGAQNPIRLVYEVALDDEINYFNIKEIVSEEYLSDPHNVNADGTINFYTNQWEHENKTGYGTVNTYSYFNPSRQNDKYYYLEDAPVYINANGTLYTGSSQPSTDRTFYRSYPVYKNNGSLRTETVYRELSDAAKATAVQRNDGSWYIPKGNVRVNLDGYTIHKSENRTGTLSESHIPFVDTHNHSINDVGYQFYVGMTLGNNGKMTVTPETGIKLSKSMANGIADPGEAFTFTLTNTTNANDSSTYPVGLVKADGTEVDGVVTFADGVATVELNVGDVLYIGGMTANDTFKIVENERVEYVATATGLSQAGTVTVNQNEIIPISFVNDERGEGNLAIAKEVEHDFGVDYQIPEDKVFTMYVTLSGIGTANATFTAEHSGDSTVTSISTDENGKFTVRLAHDEKLEIFELPVGTTAVVVEQDPGTGFTPVYLDNGKIGDGMVTVVKNNVVSVIVKNDYAAAEIYPVYITVSGNKHLSGANWQQGYSFDFKLEKLLADGTWYQLGEIEKASYGSTVFNFNDAFASERYTAPGSYYYRIVEIEPETPLGGFSYDKTVHSFVVHVGDANMDGQLEITEVVSDRPNTTVVTETTNGWNVNANFTNTYSTSGTATVTIDVTKAITNIGGADKSLAGYTFGLFDSVTGAEVSRLTTTERGFARFVLTYDAEEMNASEETFRYILKEIAPDPVPAGWSYSTEEIAVTVEVLDDGDGTISAVIYTGDEKPADAGTSIAETFINEYDPIDANLAIDFVNKQLSGRDLKANEFTFEVHSVDPDTMNTVKVLEGTNNANGKVVFDGSLTYDKVGTYYYWIMETSADGDGVTADKATYRMIVTVTDDNGALKATYSIVNATGNTITFINEYTASSVDHSIEGTKTLRGRTLINDEFTFVLTELTVDGAAVQNPRSWTAKNLSNGKIHFPAITFDKAGTYVYSVEEILPEGGKAYGITHDATQYKVTVVVRDNGEGELVIDSESVALLNNTAANAISFVNEYEANPTWAQFSGNKTLSGKVNNALLGGEFEFVLYNSNANWAQGSEREKVENGAGGVITFTRIDFSTDADQYFLVKEVNGGEVIDGITYDDTVYRVWVEVTDDLKGQLHATVHIYDGEGIPQDSISFVNIYEVTGGAVVTLSGEKIIDGREWKSGDSFTIELFEADENYNASGEAVKTATVNSANRDYSITLNYTAQDVGKTYYYVLKENGANPINGLTYSNVSYKVTVTVKDSGDGAVDVVATVDGAANNALNFTNSYSADKTTVTFEGTKSLETKTGIRKMKANDFTFDLYKANENFEIDGEALQSVKNDENGNFTFAAEDLGEAGIYYFVIKENSQNPIGGVVYDNTLYHVTVTVTDNGSGNLTVSDTAIVKVQGETSEAAEAIAFVNEYNASVANVTIEGGKTLSGRDLADGEFKFLMIEADEDFNALEGATAMVALNADGKFTFDALSFTEVGTYYFIVSEDAIVNAERVSFDDAVYLVTIEVTDDENGKLVASDPVIVKKGSADAVEAIEFTNVFIPKPIDITVDIDIVKTVINKGSDAIGPEDFEFLLKNLADEVDGITVKSDENGKAKFTLTFTEDDIGKTFNYKLTEVNSGRVNVTYSTAEYAITIAITLNKESNTLVATMTVNEAVATEIVAAFENTYDYTPENPEIPQTGDNSNLTIWVALMFISGGVAITLKKRRQENV